MIGRSSDLNALIFLGLERFSLKSLGPVDATPAVGAVCPHETGPEERLLVTATRQLQDSLVARTTSNRTIRQNDCSSGAPEVSMLSIVARKTACS